MLGLLFACQASEHGFCGSFQLLFPWFGDLSDDYVTSARSHTVIECSNCWSSHAIRFTRSSCAASSSGLKAPDKPLARDAACCSRSLKSSLSSAARSVFAGPDFTRQAWLRITGLVHR